MAKSDQNTALRGNKAQGAFTLVEVLLGVMIMVFAVSAAATLFRNAEYSAIKARVEGRLASLIRVHSERMLYMPYSTLSALAVTGSPTQTGYLYRPANGTGYGGIYPYTISTSLMLTGGGTQNEQISISASIQWQEPSPDFSKAENIQKQIDLGSHSRRRF